MTEDQRWWLTSAVELAGTALAAGRDGNWHSARGTARLVAECLTKAGEDDAKWRGLWRRLSEEQGL